MLSSRASARRKCTRTPRKLGAFFPLPCGFESAIGVPRARRTACRRPPDGGALNPVASVPIASHSIGYFPPEVTILPFLASLTRSGLAKSVARSTTCSPANMLRLQFTSTAVNAAICARPECLCYPIAILQHQSNSHLARSTNLVVRGRNITQCTCSCCKYCRFVPLYQCCALSLCQECVRKGIHVIFVKNPHFFADFLCFPACHRPITMPSAT